MTLRRIEALPLPESFPRAKDFGAKPVLIWIAPTDLFVDETYQRDLTRRSWELIRTIIEGFSWNRYKPPVCVMIDGGYHVINGQHTAIGAASLNIPEIPIFVVEAATLADRARSFVGHNTDYIRVHSVQIYRALIAGGDEQALDVDAACKRAGVRIRILNNKGIAAKAGDTTCIGLIRSLVKKRGVMMSRKVLEALATAKCAPIYQEHIRAAEFLICDRRYDPGVVSTICRIDGDAGFNAARARAKADRTAGWRALADRWERKIRSNAA